MSIRRHLHWGWILSSATFVLLPGCDRGGARPERPTEPVAVVVEDDTASDAVRTVFGLMQARLRAVAAGDEQAAAAHLAELSQLLDEQELQHMPILGKIDDDTELQVRVARVWTAALAYYIEGVQWDGMRPAGRAESLDGPGVTVVAPAAVSGRAATIRVRVVERPVGWRVAEIDFLPPTQADAAAQVEASATGP